MTKSGISHMLSFLISLIVGHAILLLLGAYIPPVYGFFLRFGQAIALLFKITYSQKIMAAFIIATILSFFIGILFHKLLKLGR
jgi:hypothetical protein